MDTEKNIDRLCDGVESQQKLRRDEKKSKEQRNPNSHDFQTSDRRQN